MQTSGRTSVHRSVHKLKEWGRKKRKREAKRQRRSTKQALIREES